MPQRIVLGVSGASGMPLAKVVLETLAHAANFEVHCIVSAHARQVLAHECGAGPEFFAASAHALYEPDDMTIGPASGSWLHKGMIVCPCSMSSLAAIAHGLGHNSLHRAADVTLKERRPLLLVVRESPFTLQHIRNMEAAAESGATIMPFMPPFYQNTKSLEQMMRYFAGRLLDQLKVPHTLITRWSETAE